MTTVSIYSLYRYAEYGMQDSDHARREDDETEENGQMETAVSEQDQTTEYTELLTQADTDMTIRVRILGNDYQEQIHQKVTVTSADGIVVWRGREQSRIQAGDIWEISMEEIKAQNRTVCVILEPEQGGTITLPELVRSQKDPSYSGRMVLYPEEEGIALINEVNLEEYLCSVVSSEMPSDYPQEALCAQAVCARTYALQCMDRAKEESSISDLDDSVSFQVYNNYGKNEASVTAAKRTCGMILNCDEVLYYSTSCLTDQREDLDDEEAFRQFLMEEPEEDAEYGSPWVRWSVSVSEEEILENLEREYGCRWSQLEEMKVQNRSGNGQVQEMVFSGGGEEITAEGEYRIRKVLSAGTEQVILRDGKKVTGLKLLPSAYFFTEKSETNRWEIFGGGYGHGRGMSQYGAAAMAAKGADYREILMYYYG